MPRENNKELEEERRARSNYDLIRLRLNRLEKNIEKLAPIPAKYQPPKPKPPEEFVRNVVGSSAAAGSAEFHIYRNNKRKEIERLNYLEQEGRRQDLNEEFERRKQERIETEEKRTEKKRRKRQRRKEKMKQAKKSKKVDGSSNSSSDSEFSNEDDDNTDEQNLGEKNDDFKNGETELLKEKIEKD